MINKLFKDQTKLPLEEFVLEDLNKEATSVTKELPCDEHVNIDNSRLPQNGNDRPTSLIKPDLSLTSVEKKKDIVTKEQTYTNCNRDHNSNVVTNEPQVSNQGPHT